MLYFSSIFEQNIQFYMYYDDKILFGTLSKNDGIPI